MLKKIKLPLIIFLTLLLVVGVASFAWFYEKNVIQVQSDDDFAITVGTNLQVALKENGAYTSTLTLSTVDLKVEDCSSDGTTFITFNNLDDNDRPVEGGYKIVDQTNEEEWQQYYIELELLVKTHNAISVYLGKDSAISPKTEDHFSNMYPNVNADLIAGCVRVAFFEVLEDGTEDLKCVWAPNSHYQLINDNYVFSATKTGQRESTYSYYSLGPNGAELKTYTQSDILNGKFVLAEGEKLCSSSNVNLAPKLLTFDKEGVEQIKELKIRIWFEGTDREAHAAMNKGQVNYLINLMGFRDKDPHPTASVEALNSLKAVYNSGNDTVSFTYGDGSEPLGLLYSTNLIDWTTLGSNADFSMNTNKGKTIYFRLNEDANHCLGTDIVCFQFPETDWTDGYDTAVHPFAY